VYDATSGPVGLSGSEFGLGIEALDHAAGRAGGKSRHPGVAAVARGGPDGRVS
jgi:hypothetical protein